MLRCVLPIFYLMVFIIVPVSAQGASLRYVDSPQPHLVLSTDGGSYAVFRRLDDLWLVGASANKEIKFSNSNNANIIETEKLYVPSGHGLRIGFNELSGISVDKKGNKITIFLNQEKQPEQLPIMLELQGSNMVMKVEDGMSNLHRAVSFTTRESYLVIPVSSNKGVAKAKNIAAIRQLRSAMGAVFVSSAGVPLGFKQGGKTVTFKPMTDAISAVMTRSQQKISFSILDDLLSASDAKTSKPKPPFLPRKRESSLYSKLLLPTITMNKESTFSEAMEQMRSALVNIEQLRVPSGRDVVTKNEPIPNNIDVNKPKALPDNQLLPNFGNRTRREMAILENRLAQKWYLSKMDREKNSAALRLAGLKVFMGEYPEALGVIKTLQHQNKNTPHNDAVVQDSILLEGITLSLLERYEEANKRLEDVAEDSLDKFIWQGVSSQGLGNNEQALEFLADSIKQVRSYPNHIAQIVRYKYAAALFEFDELNDAMQQIDKLAVSGGDSRVMAQAQLLMARIYEKQEQTNLAEQIYINVAGNKDAEVSSQALFYFLNLLTDRGDIGPEAAAIRFENLRFLWRGDVVEEESLFKLGELYIRAKDYKHALQRLKYLTVHFPQSPHTPQAAEMMSKIFYDLFLGQREDAVLDELGMLGLYYDFRELTPSGGAGDKVIVGVASRLANLGLYDRAVDIIEQQLKFRTKDPKSIAILGMKIAQLHYKNFSAPEGLAALDKTAQKGLPALLVNDRKIMRAKLLSLARESDKALKVAKQLSGKEAKELQSELAWETGSYKDVVAALKPVFDKDNVDDWTLNDKTKFLRLATGLAKTGSVKELGDLALLYKQNIEDNELTEHVNFLIQAGAAQSPKEDEEAVKEDAALNKDASLWVKAEGVLRKQNNFNRDYRKLRAHWLVDNEQSRKTELEERQREIQQGQPRFR